MPVGRRCTICGETWPDEILYQDCPQCGEKTDRCSGVTPMQSADAKRILLYALFEKYYDRWCQRRGQPAEGPLLDLPELTA